MCLSRINRRLRTIYILPLEVDLRAVRCTLETVILRRQNGGVLRRHQVDAARNNVLGDGLGSRKLRTGSDGTVRDCVDVDGSVHIRRRYGVLSLCNRSVLRSNYRVNEWSYESNRESSGSDSSAATASYTV